MGAVAEANEELLEWLTEFRGRPEPFAMGEIDTEEYARWVMFLHHKLGHSEESRRQREIQRRRDEEFRRRQERKEEQARTLPRTYPQYSRGPGWAYGKATRDRLYSGITGASDPPEYGFSFEETEETHPELVEEYERRLGF